MLAAVEAGAGGYLLNDGSEADFGSGIRRLLAGEAPICRLIKDDLRRARALVKSAARPSASTARADHAKSG